VAKILALGAYFYQAALAFGLLIVVARLLPAADYAGYSIFIASTQFVAICCFDWIRYACTRFYPGRDAAAEADQRRTLWGETAAAALVCVIAGAIVIPLGLPPVIAGLGVAVAIVQGGSDIHFTMLRFRRQFSAFSGLQGFRATILATGSIAGAWMGHSLVTTATGLVGAYLVFAAIALVVELRVRRPAGRWSSDIAREHLSYGSISAGASVIGLLAPLGLRLILSSTLGPIAAAGALLAVDLLQKPFVLIIAALQAIQYPDVVTAFDHAERKGLRQHLGQYYALLVTLSLITGTGILAILLPVSAIAVAPELRSSFLAGAPILVFLFMLRSITQFVSTTPAHLEKDLMQMLVLALVDCIGLDVLAWGAALLPNPSAMTIIAAAAIGTIAAGLFGLRILSRLPFEIYATPMLIGVASLIVPTLLVVMPLASIWVSAGLAVAAGGAISLAALYALYRIMGFGRAAATPEMTAKA